MPDQITASQVCEEFPLLVRCLATVTDARKARGKVHPLAGVLALVVLGLMAGHRSLVEIARWADCQPKIVLGSLGLRRAPCIATLWRLLQLVRVGEVREALLSFAAVLQERRAPGKGSPVALDGKTLRGTWEGGAQLHVLNAFATESALALDQVRVDNHLVEGEAAQAWIATLTAHFPALEVLTGDAGYADQSLCTAIVAGRREYVVKVKKTNPSCSRTSPSCLPMLATPK